MEQPASPPPVQEIVMHRAPAASLMISPNLNALLEHDEKVRQSTARARDRPQASDVSSPVKGLPPPPRGPRKNRTRPPPPIVHPPPTTAPNPPASSLPNPFINPAPSIETAISSRSDVPTSAPLSSFHPPLTISHKPTASFNDARSYEERHQYKAPRSLTPAPHSHSITNSNQIARAVQLPPFAPPFDDALQNYKFPPNVTPPPDGSRRGKPPSMSRPFLSRAVAFPKSTETDHSAETQHDSGPSNHSSERLVGGDDSLSAGFALMRPSLSQLKPKSSPSFSHGFVHTQPPDSAAPRLAISSATDAPSSSSRFASTSAALSFGKETFDLARPNNFMNLYSLALAGVYPKDPPLSPPVLRNPRSKSHSPNPRSKEDSERERKDSFVSSARPSDESLLREALTHQEAHYCPLPETTNRLNAQERAELVKKTRKLANIFGQTPGACELCQNPDGANLPSYLAVSPSAPVMGRHSRGTGSASSDVSGLLSLTTEDTEHLYNKRRHSLPPLSPSKNLSPPSSVTEVPRSAAQHRNRNAAQGLNPTSKASVSRFASQVEPDSSSSFIDLSDEDGTATTFFPPNTGPDTPDRFQNSSPSYSVSPSSVTPQPLTEEERRRKREKLAKLHRFLGSRVPPNLVLGITDPVDNTLPPLAAHDNERELSPLQRRRSETISTFSTSSVDNLERMKEELDEKEKAINVRRKQKMQQVFGVAPPQTLYHTRQISVPQGIPSRNFGSTVQPAAPAGSRDMIHAALKKMKAKSHHRPGSAGSVHEQLLDADQREASWLGQHGGAHSTQNVYKHYQHSLNSLVSIIDRDDRQSLAELHLYMNSNPGEPSQGPSGYPEADQASITSSKTARRRSLPARSSTISLNSQFGAEPDLTDFQLRRKKAAKLTQFFGVNYRELICDVLESIERGVDEDRKQGALEPDEFEDLLQRLRKLKTTKAPVEHTQLRSAGFQFQ